MPFTYSMDTIHSNDTARLYNFSVIIGSSFQIIHETMIIGITTPKLTIEPIQVPWTASSFNIPGKATFEPITLTIRENENGLVYRAFYEWANEILDIKSSGPNKYASTKPFAAATKPIVISQLNHAGVPSMVYNISNAWPTGLPTINYTYEGSAIVQYDIEIDYLNYSVV